MVLVIFGSLPIIQDMEDVREFESKLSQAVQDKRQNLEMVYLPQMNKDLQLMVSACNTVLNALIKKSVFHNSSAHYDARIDEILPPSVEPVNNDKEKVYELGSRFGQYLAMLDYVVHYFQFSCDYLTPPRIAKLNALLRTFNWDALLLSSENPNTASFAEILQNFKRCGDNLAINIVFDGVSQLSRAQASVLKTLKMLSDFQRELYKLNVRSSVIPRTGLPPDAPANNDSLRAVKKVFPHTMRDEPFYTELIREIFLENSGPEAEKRRADVFARLEVAKSASKKKEETEFDARGELAGGFRALGGNSQQLVLLINKLAENQKVLQAAQVTFFTRLRDLFRKAFNLPAEELEIPITVTDPATQAKKREIIRFNQFLETLRRKARLFAGFSAKGSAVWQKLDAMTNDQLLDILSKNISELNALLRQCDGMDEYFKSSVKGEAKSKIRGIKIEISALRNTFLKANRIRADYSARMEEQEQLKRLGIQ